MKSDAKDAKPLIGITQPFKTFPGGYWALALAVRLAGGRPLKLNDTPEGKRQEKGAEPRPQALILGGGRDIFPQHFFKKPKKGYLYDHHRDELELHWLKWAEARNLPVLGVCRGAQLMNVQRGGTLHMSLREAGAIADYPQHFWGYAFYRKTIRIQENSLLHRVMGVDSLRVNSIHSQSIEILGHSLQVSADESNGIIQAVEDPEMPFYLGVQFHPEFLIGRRPFRALFHALVRAAAGHAQ